MARLIDEKVVEQYMNQAGIEDMSYASIREIAALVDTLQKATG